MKHPLPRSWTDAPPGRIPILLSIALHAGIAAVGTHVLVSGNLQKPAPQAPVLVIHPPPAQPPMNFSPEPPAPFARESREPEPLPLPIRTEDEPVRFDPDRPAVVVAAEALPEDPIPPEVLVMRIGPSGPPASRPPAPETAVDTVTEPSPSSPIRIDYPRLARQRGMEGAVTLEVSVDAEGAVATIRVAESSGHAILDEAAVRGLERVTFEPARRNGIPVPWTFRQTVRFSLR